MKNFRSTLKSSLITHLLVLGAGLGFLTARVGHAADPRESEWNGELEALLDETPAAPISRESGFELGANAFLHGKGSAYGLDGGIPLLSGPSGGDLHLKLEVTIGKNSESASSEIRYRRLRIGFSSRAELSEMRWGLLKLKAEALLTRSDGLYGQNEEEVSETRPTLRGGVELKTGRWAESLAFEWTPSRFGPEKSIQFRIGYFL